MTSAQAKSGREPQPRFRELSWFAPTCREHLSGVLGTLGFRPGDHDPFAVEYCSPKTVLRVSYWPEEAPDFYLLVGIGVGRSTVAVEYMLGDVPTDRRFSSEADLDAVCERLSHYFLNSTTAQAALVDEHSVAAAVDLGLEKTAQLDRDEADTAAATRERQVAADAWNSENWDSAIDHLRAIPASQVRPSDLARLAYATERSAQR